MALSFAWNKNSRYSSLLRTVSNLIHSVTPYSQLLNKYYNTSNVISALRIILTLFSTVQCSSAFPQCFSLIITVMIMLSDYDNQICMIFLKNI